MKLFSIANEFITYKRANGAQYRSEAYTMNALCKTFPDCDIAAITSEDIKKFIFEPFHSKYVRYRHLRIFWKFVIERNYAPCSPLPAIRPKNPPVLEPYIYSHEELKRIFAEAGLMTRKNDPLFAITIRTILILLYGAGLRLNEALSLKRDDVNIDDCILTIRDTKFFKSRLVPISPQLSEVLQSYIMEQDRWRHPANAEGYFFATTRRPYLLDQMVRYQFKQLCKRLGIQRTDDAPFKPRLHDLRHSFARHRLLAGYRNKEDLQSLLVGLSIYLGHSDLNHTQCYMTLAPELLSEASQRFEHYALQGVSHVR